MQALHRLIGRLRFKTKMVAMASLTMVAFVGLAGYNAYDQIATISERRAEVEGAKLLTPTYQLLDLSMKRRLFATRMSLGDKTAEASLKEVEAKIDAAIKEHGVQRQLNSRAASSNEAWQDVTTGLSSLRQAKTDSWQKSFDLNNAWVEQQVAYIQAITRDKLISSSDATTYELAYVNSALLPDLLNATGSMSANAVRVLTDLKKVSDGTPAAAPAAEPAKAPEPAPAEKKKPKADKPKKAEKAAEAPPADEGLGAFGDAMGGSDSESKPAEPAADKPAEPAKTEVAAAPKSEEKPAEPKAAEPAPAPAAPSTISRDDFAQEKVELGGHARLAKLLQQKLQAQFADLSKVDPTLKDSLGMLFEEQSKQQSKLQDYTAGVLSTSTDGSVDGYVDRANNAIAAQVKLNKESIQLLQNRVQASSGEAKQHLLFETVILLLLTIVVWWVQRATLSGTLRSVHVLSEGTRRLAEGDLTTNIEVYGQDELSRVAQDFNAMIASFRTIIADAQTNGMALAQAAESMHNTAQQVAESSAQQSDAASSMASSIEEMSVSISHVSESAHNAHDLSAKTDELSESGGDVISRAASEMRVIADSVRDTSLAIEGLGEHSDKISSVIQVIKDVAGQTNLLALNAAIEAARAGEQGRGFAVVADEVRKLAERTTQATLEIAHIIESIQDATMRAILSMGDVVNKVNEGVTYADQAGQSIETINASGKEVLGAVDEISTALNEQNRASQLIAEQVEKIAQMTESNSISARAGAEAARDMAVLAYSMQQSVSQFKVE